MSSTGPPQTAASVGALVPCLLFLPRLPRQSACDGRGLSPRQNARMSAAVPAPGDASGAWGTWWLVLRHAFHGTAVSPTERIAALYPAHRDHVLWLDSPFTPQDLRFRSGVLLCAISGSVRRRLHMD